MKKLKLIGFAILAVMLLSSCGGSSKQSAEETASTEQSVDSTATEVVADAPAGEDWDAVLTSYEETIDQYLALMKKVSAGDANAMQEYPAVMQKLTDIATKLTNLEGQSLTAAQTQRFIDLQTKVTNAATQMQQ